MTFVRKDKVNSIKEVLDRLIAYFENAPKIECDRYPDYPAEVGEALSLLPLDTNYLENHEKIEGKPYEEMTKDEIATMMTFLRRGERFCDAFILGYVENGDLLKLLLRLRELESQK